jgi:polyhydroxyalkanoate synthesis regulator phasin
MRLDDLRKTFEAAIGNLTPSKAQELAKGLLEPGAAREQVSKTATDLIEWSQRSRDRLRDLMRREVQEQVRGMGVATQSELDALRKRVRELERAAGMTASGRARTTRKRTTAATSSGTRRTTTKRSPATKRSAAASKRSTASRST